MLFKRRPRKGEGQQGTALDQIVSAESHLLCAPWKGSPCLVKVRVLSDLEIQTIGNFSLIETEEYKWSRAPGRESKWSEVLAYANQSVKICKAALISPTYDEIFQAIGKNAFNAEVKAQVENINAMLTKMLDGPAKQELEEKRDSLLVAWDVILPGDFMGIVIEDALGIKKTDIKKVTEEMLYNAAILAEKGKKAPHEYITGVFSSFNIRDIDTQAWIIYDTRVEEARAEARRSKGN